MPQDLLQELLDDPDRDTIPSASPVVSYDPDDDEPEFLTSLDAHSPRRARLTRRGHCHGYFAALEPSSTERPFPEPDALQKRWRSARPAVLRSAFSDLTHHAAAGLKLFDALQEPDPLRPWLHKAALPAGLTPQAANAPTADPDRDLQKILFDEPGSVSQPASHAAWIKLARLSNHPDDSSLRLRIGFGTERDDDASPILERQRLISQLGRALLPGMDEICSDEHLAARLGRLLRGPVLLTQPLTYWNRPDGGALFHHDAFGENSPAGQRGVLYVQLGGETLWLALSINDLAQRVREMIEAITLGDLQELRELLYPDDGLAPLLPILKDDDLLRQELGSPGCGRFASLVNYGPSFTAWLADSGHACWLREGDAILLPNHGLHHTCMHSVFCVSDHTTYALSLAVRLDAEAPAPSA
jgi:hypothetical protein